MSLSSNYPEKTADKCCIEFTKEVVLLQMNHTVIRMCKNIKL